MYVQCAISFSGTLSLLHSANIASTMIGIAARDGEETALEAVAAPVDVVLIEIGMVVEEIGIEEAVNGEDLKEETEAEG